MSSVSNGLYFLTLPLVSVMRVIYRIIRHARYLYIKRNVEKVWGARYTLGVLYLSKNTAFFLFITCFISLKYFAFLKIYSSQSSALAMGWKVRGSNANRRKIFFLQNVRTSSRVHPASC